MRTLPIKVISSLAIITMAVGCGQDSNHKSTGSEPVPGPGAQRQLEEAPVDGSNIRGHFQAKFTTMNPHVNGTIPGSANFYRKEGEDRLYVYVRLFAGGVKAWHMQHIYTGDRCPTMSDDTNGDGFIDINEAEAVLGKILIPLDSDISSQRGGNRFFPLADASGYYHYERITSFKRFLSDLQGEDTDPEDDMVKLAPGKGLQIIGRPVLIQGVVDTIDLPETVGSKGRRRPTQTLPIVCGIFEEVTKAPGDPYIQDEIPGPIADVVEGQDRPAEDPIPDTGEETGGTGSGSNDSDNGDGPVSDGEGRTSGRTSGGRDTGSTDRDDERNGEVPGRTGSTTGRSTGGGGEDSSSDETSESSTSSSTGSSTTGGTSTSSSSTGSSTSSSTSTSSTGGDSTERFF